jgi:hypothetical protein
MIFPYEIMLEIAKYCDSSTILAITRVSHMFASTRMETDDTHLIPYNHYFKQGLFDNTILKNRLWKKAMETQFPNKKYLSFYGDAENYFIAKHGKFFILIDSEAYDDICIYEYNKMTMNACFDIIYKFKRDNSPEMIIFDIEDRFIVINNDYEVVGQLPTQKEAESILKCMSRDFGTIVDLKYLDIEFLRYKRRVIEGLTPEYGKIWYDENFFEKSEEHEENEESEEHEESEESEESEDHEESEESEEHIEHIEHIEL